MIVMTAVMLLRLSFQNEPAMGRAASIRAQAIAAPRREALERALGAERLQALRDSAAVLLWSRLLVFAVAVAAVQIAGVATQGYDDVVLTQPFGSFGDALFAPLARWDAVWYLRVAAHGYAGPSQGFFPLYPLLVKALAGFSHSPRTLLAASYATSLAAFAGALYLLHRLVALELGPRFAKPTLVLLAFFPGAIWFGAPYTESLFLLLVVGSFYAARTGHWALAGIAAALASATRSPGIALVAPLAVLWWVQRPRRARNLAWIGLAPLGIVAFSAYLGLAHGDALAWQHWNERVWFHHFAPLGGIVDGTRAAFDGVRQLLSGSSDRIYFTPAGGDPFTVAWHNLQDFGFLLFALVAVVGVCRRLPAAYGAFSLAALALPLSTPVTPEPLMSFGRYAAVAFPLFMWLALVCDTRRRRVAVLVPFVLLLIVSTARFATWHWVA